MTLNFQRAPKTRLYDQQVKNRTREEAEFGISIEIICEDENYPSGTRTKSLENTSTFFWVKFPVANVLPYLG